MTEAPEDHRVALTHSSRRTREIWLIALFSLMVAAFYAWTALATSRGPFFGHGMRGYYNLQTDGFLKGQLALDAKVDPFLLTLKNPWDPVARGPHGLHDASYFNGQYHMYFGVTPVVAFFLPFRLLSGVNVSETTGILVFGWVGFLAAASLFWQLRWRYFPSVSGFWFLCGVIALGLANMLPTLLRRAGIWEVPITAAYAFASVAMLFLYQGFHYRRRWLHWALASFFLGMAIGARPVYLFGAAALLTPFLYLWRNYTGTVAFWRTTEFRRAAAALFLPIMAVGLGLAAYNFARFGSITEFGQRYQMAGEDVTKLQLFSWSYPLYGLRLYLWEPATWSRYFPFVNVINPPPAPAGHFGIEDPFGILPNIPYVVLALACCFLPAGQLAAGDRFRLRVFCGALAILTVLTLLTVVSFGGVTNRYMVDFVPGIILLASVGLLAVFARANWRGINRAIAFVVVGGVLIFSVAFNVLASLRHNDLFRAENPSQYRAIAHTLNYLSYTYDRVLGRKYGPLELKVIFPKVRQMDHYEAFLVTGNTFKSDYVYLRYLPDDQVQFGFEHTSYGGSLGKPVKVKPGEVQTVLVDLGSLYPPDPHPYYDHLPKSLPRILQRTLRVSVDGQVSLRGDVECYDATAREPELGSAGNRPAFKNDFSGKIISTRHASELRPVVPPIEYGPAKITLRFPIFSGRRAEPIVCTGESGKGDVIYVNYLDDHSISFGHDNWGAGGRTGDPVSIDYSASHELIVDFGALYSKTDTTHPKNPSSEQLTIKLDGNVVMEAMAPFHPSAPENIVFGRNAIQSSAAQPVFTGEIERISRVAP